MSDMYPIVMVRGDANRQAFNEADVIRLQFEGWRRADEKPYERGGFLPPPRGAADTAQTATAADVDTKTARRKTS